MAWTPPQTWSVSENPTAAKLNANIRDNMREVWRELAYVEFTANVTPTGTTSGAPTEIVSAGAITFTAEPILVEFFAPGASDGGSGANRTHFILRDGTSVVADPLGFLDSVSGIIPVTLFKRLTPTAASHTYNFAAYTGDGVGSTIHADADAPGFIRIMQKGS